MVIDLQSSGLNAMSASDARQYFDKLGQDIDAMRDRGIEVTWATMGENQRLITPDHDQAARPLNDGELKAAYFLDHEHPDRPVAVDQERLGIFRGFLHKHGPRTDEAVHVKFFKSAFMETSDFNHDADATQALSHEYGGLAGIAEQATAGGTMRAYMQEKAPDEVLVMGGMADHCVAENAIGVRQHLGAKATVLCDNVLSWAEGNTHGMTQQPTAVRWRDGTSDGQAADAWHQENVQAGIDHAITRPPPLGLSAETAATVKSGISFTNTDQALAAHPPNHTHRVNGQASDGADPFISDILERKRHRDMVAEFRAEQAGPHTGHTGPSQQRRVEA